MEMITVSRKGWTKHLNVHTYTFMDPVAWLPRQDLSLLPTSQLKEKPDALRPETWRSAGRPRLTTAACNRGCVGSSGE